MPRTSTLLCLLALLLAFAGPARAQYSRFPPMNEHPTAGEYQLSRAAFEDAYAFNDTALAIIRMRYAKRNTGLNIARFVLLPAPLLGLIGRRQEPTVVTTSTTVTIQPNKYTYEPWVAPVVYGLLGVSLGGLMGASAHSREQLYQEVRQYRATRRLPATVRPAALVPHLMQVQQSSGQPPR